MVKSLAQHSDYCTCQDCNEIMYDEVTGYNKGDQMGKGKKQKKKERRAMSQKEEDNLHTKVVDAITKSQELVPLQKGTQVKFNHAKTCPCTECSTPADDSKKTSALDHGNNCVCYKCKQDKSFGSKNTNSSYNYKPATAYKPCHEGNVFVFKHEGISVYGGGNLKDPEPNKVDIVLDLDRNVRTVSWEDDLPKDWESRKRSSSQTKVLDLFIKDMHAPEHVDAGFWKLFWSDLRKEAHKNGGKLSILVMCQGGHGRTGVVIASLIMASAYNKKGIPEDVHPVKWLRDNYCEKAVESSRQCDYLKRLWNMKFIDPTKGGTTSFQKGATTTTTITQTSTDSNDNDDAAPEIPTADTKCEICNTLRTANNRVLFSGDLEKFECDTCFGKRADDLEAQEEDLEKILALEDNRTDLTSHCEGANCYDTYHEPDQIWTTTHTFTTGCEMIPQKGESLDGIPINDMTDDQYAKWTSSLG